MVGSIDAAWEGKAVDRTATTLQPREKTRASRFKQFKLHWSLGLLLDDHRPIANPAPSHQIADSNLDEVATAKLAVDRKVKQCSVSQSMLPIQHETDLPNLFGLQRPFCAKLPSCVPGRSLLNRVI